MEQPKPSWIDQLERPLALVFGGGASLGASQVGMARALVEAGVEPDLIVGTSVGALNGSFLARQFDAPQIDELEGIWHGLTREAVFPGVTITRAIRMLTGGVRHLASKQGLEGLVETYLPETHAELAIPTTVIASDLVSGEKVPLSEGDLRRNVTTSASIPFVFEPVDDGERSLVDGGVTSNVPVLPARQAGANSLIVLDPGYPCALDTVPSDLLGFSLHIVTLMIRHQSHGALHFLADDSPIVYIPPPCPVDVAPHEFDRTDDLIEAGYHRAVEFLRGLTIDGPGVYGHPHFHGDEAEIEAAATSP
jgi:NTE family protein